MGETEIANADATRWRSDPDVLTMERLRDGETDAFQVLFNKHHEAIARFADRFLHSRDRAEEVAQTVFLRLFRARKRYRPTARFTTFLYRIARNVCLNELRRFERSMELESLDAKIADRWSLVDLLPDTKSPGLVQRLVCREEATEMMEVLNRLPSNQRSALLLKRVEGFSLRDVADSLETSTDAVKSLIFRATATLRRDLAE